MSVLKSLKKKATKLAVKAAGTVSHLMSQAKTTKHVLTQKGKVFSIETIAKGFNAQLKEAAKGQWTDSAEKSVTTAIKVLA